MREQRKHAKPEDEPASVNRIDTVGHRVGQQAVCYRVSEVRAGFAEEHALYVRSNRPGKHRVEFAAHLLEQQRDRPILLRLCASSNVVTSYPWPFRTWRSEFSSIGVRI